MTWHKFMSEGELDAIGRKVKVFDTFNVQSQKSDITVSKVNVSLDKLIMIYETNEIHQMNVLERSMKHKYNLVPIKTKSNLEITYWDERDEQDKAYRVIVVGKTAIKSPYMSVDFIGRHYNEVSVIYVTCTSDIDKDTINFVIDANGNIVKQVKRKWHGEFIREEISREIRSGVEINRGKYFSSAHLDGKCNILNGGTHIIYGVSRYKDEQEEEYISIIHDKRTDKISIKSKKYDARDLSKREQKQFNGLAVFREYKQTYKEKYFEETLMDLINMSPLMVERNTAIVETESGTIKAENDNTEFEFVPSTRIIRRVT